MMNTIERAVSPLGGLADLDNQEGGLGCVPYGSPLGRSLVLDEVRAFCAAAPAVEIAEVISSLFEAIHCDAANVTACIDSCLVPIADGDNPMDVLFSLLKAFEAVRPNEVADCRQKVA